MDQNSRDRWKYLATWEKWLRNRFCYDKPNNIISKLPERPKSAYRFFYEHQMQMIRQEKEEGLEKGSKSYFSRGGYFGHMTSEYK